MSVHRSIVQRKDWDGKRDDAESGGFKVQCWDVERCPASGTYPPQGLTTSLPLKAMVVGRRSFSIGFRSLFRGELLNFGRVANQIHQCELYIKPQYISNDL